MVTKNPWYSSDPAEVAKGGTGAASITDHALIVGSGTTAITEIGPLTDGQLVIGSTGADPVAASITSSGGTVAITSGAGTINLEAAPGSGSYTVNVETLTGNKTLTSGTDETVQLLDANGSPRSITLDTASASTGDLWIIQNTASASVNVLNIYQAAVLIDLVEGQSIKEFLFDGTNWIGLINGCALPNVCIGRKATCTQNGVSIGEEALTTLGGVAIGYKVEATSQATVAGYETTGQQFSVSLGAYADASARSVCLGSYTDSGTAGSLWYTIAKGIFSKCVRFQEEWRTLDASDPGANDNSYGVGEIGWSTQTTNDTPTEILLKSGGSDRFTILGSSIVSFILNAAAYNVTDDVGKSWTIRASIKRDASNNTSLVGSTIIEDIIQDGLYDTTYNTSNWDITVAADDVNEAFIVTVTGEATKTIRWVIGGSYSEARF